MCPSKRLKHDIGKEILDLVPDLIRFPHEEELLYIHRRAAGVIAPALNSFIFFHERNIRQAEPIRSSQFSPFSPLLGIQVKHTTDASMPAPEGNLVILHIYLDPSYLSRTLSIPESEAQTRIDAELSSLRSVKGLDMHIVWLDPSSESSINKFKIAVESGPPKESGKMAWDGVGFAWEFRSDEGFGELFEELVNWCRRQLLLFPARPLGDGKGVVESCRRRFTKWAKEFDGEREANGKG